MQDLRDALGALRSAPLVTAAAVVTLALGIGANAAIFSILDSLLLRPLPVRDPSSLVAIGSETPGEDAELMNRTWLAIRDRHLLDGAFAWASDGLSEVEGGETRPVNATSSLSVIWNRGNNPVVLALFTAQVHQTRITSSSCARRSCRARLPAWRTPRRRAD